MIPMRYLVLGLLCLVAVIGYVQRLGINTAHEPIELEFVINNEQFGLLGTVWLLGYALFQIPSGWLADRVGSRSSLVGFAIAWSILVAALTLCSTLESLLVCWFLMGVAMAGIFPCAAKAIAAWFPDTEKATASGLLGSFTMLGSAAASFLTGRLLVDAGWPWRWILLLYAGVGIAWALLYLAAVPEKTHRQTLASPLTRADWWVIFTSGPMWFLCGQQFFRAGAMIFFLNWFPKYLRQTYQLEPNTAGDNAALVNLAALAGGLIGGFASDWLLRRTGNRRLARQGIAVVGMSLAAGLVLLTLRVDSLTFALFLFALAAFVATFGGVAGYTTAIELGGRRVGLVFSIMNMCGNLGAAIVNQVVGSLQQRTGSWSVVVVAVAVILVVDAVCWALLNPKRPLFEDTDERR